MYAVVNKTAKQKTASQFATVRLRASAAFYFLLRCHVVKRDKQRTRTSNVTILAVGKKKYYILGICDCRLRYPVRKAHAPYCHLWPVRLYSILTHYLINGLIFERKKVTEHKMCVLIFYTAFVWNISHSKKKISDMMKNVYRSSCKVSTVLVRF